MLNLPSNTKRKRIKTINFSLKFIYLIFIYLKPLREKAGTNGFTPVPKSSIPWQEAVFLRQENRGGAVPGTIPWRAELWSFP